MMQPIKSILIIGGGTSGWLAAAFLARKLGPKSKDGVAVTLIEASDIPTIGVGEAGIPPMRSMIAALGISEAEFLRSTNGTFKLGIRFDGWRKPVAGKMHQYFHIFGKYGQLGHEMLAPYWLLDREDGGGSLVDYSMIEAPVLEAGRGPKRIGDPDFGGPLDYSYNFDAGLLAQVLKKVAVEHGATHLVGKIGDPEFAEDGSIAAVNTDEHGKLQADLFIDCTGFRAQLIEKSLGVPFVSASDFLFCDSAVALRVPYEREDEPIPPYTIASAYESGWCWNIFLGDRLGSGYVYSSRHVSSEDAERQLRRHLGEARTEGMNANHLKFRVGRRTEHWKKNCIAMGLSGGFVEPLESTGIYLVDIALRWLVDFFPTSSTLEQAAHAFNERMEQCYDDIFDFVKLHYLLTDREEPFWKENTRIESAPEGLQRKMRMWEQRVPGQYEFGHLPNVFGLSNYIQILYGMNHYPQLTHAEARYPLREEARRQAERIRAIGQDGVKILPPHRELIAAYHAQP